MPVFKIWCWSFRRAERASISSSRAAAQARLRALGRSSGSSAVAEAAPSLVRRFPRSFQLLGLQPALEAHGAHKEASRLGASVRLTILRRCLFWA